MYWSISVSFSVYSFTFVGIFPNFPAFLEFRLEISFCISASLICLKLKREKRHSQDKKKILLFREMWIAKIIFARAAAKNFFLSI